MKGSRSWAVDLNENKLTAREIELNGEHFVPGEVKGLWIVSR